MLRILFQGPGSRVQGLGFRLQGCGFRTRVGVPQEWGFAKFQVKKTARFVKKETGQLLDSTPVKDKTGEVLGILWGILGALPKKAP